METDILKRAEVNRRIAEREKARERYGERIGTAYDELINMSNTFSDKEREMTVDRFANLIFDSIKGEDRQEGIRAVKALVNLTRNVATHYHKELRMK